jgi:putative sigma-54 modulation protein
MQVNINAVHFKTDKQLEKFITGKLEKVGKFHEQVIGSDVTLKLENTEKPENKVAEIRLKIKGNDLISIKQCKTFEEATDLATEALLKQLKKVKDKKIKPSSSKTVKIKKENTTIGDMDDVE